MSISLSGASTNELEDLGSTSRSDIDFQGELGTVI